MQLMPKSTNHDFVDMCLLFDANPINFIISGIQFSEISERYSTTSVCLHATSTMPLPPITALYTTVYFNGWDSSLPLSLLFSSLLLSWLSTQTYLASFP